jgi:tetratricopeptide (TPR) repeat protein
MKCIIQAFLLLLMQLFTEPGTAQEYKKNYTKGTLAYQKGNYIEAVFQFQKCLNNHTPDSAQVYNALGDAYSFWEDYNNAILNYNLALNMKYKPSEELFFKLSTAYYNTKDFIKSIYYCKQILVENKICMDAKVYWRMNLLYSLNSESENAITILKIGAKNGVLDLQKYCEKRSIPWKD